uniref:Interferon 1AF1 n=1 Tax=Microcebus murinus TaxID=30608 RepID=A0A7R8C3G8_MICMU|nr:TPA: interferon 1AF1 [Microcebus murinus]
MASSFSLLMALVGLSCMSLCSLGCKMPLNHRQGNLRALRLLAQMRKISPFSCLQDRNDFRFPQEEFDGNHHQKIEAVSAVYEMFQQIFNLFISKDSFEVWNRNLLDRLLNQVFQQIDDLKACLNEEEETEETAQVIVKVIYTVRRYFQRIIFYLQEKKYSSCAWEIVRLEIMKALSITNRFEQKLVMNHTWVNIEKIVID